jgi:YegS/Rv2252/BmrU family lipid kinase
VQTYIKFLGFASFSETFSIKLRKIAFKRLYLYAKCDKNRVKMKEVYAIINPVSGVGSKERLPTMISARCAAAGVGQRIVFTECAGHAAMLTRQAVEEGVDCVIAVGGDGTVNEVAQNLLNTDVALGILPKGSGNGLARELCIPLDVRGALDVVFEEHISTIDACKANEHTFFCTCGVGFDATISEEFAKEKRRGSLTYLKNIVEEYLSYKPDTYELHIDEHTIREEAFLITCANASQWGNNAFIAPHADITDGKMDVTVLSRFTTLDIGALAIQLFTKTLDHNSKLKTYRTSSARIVRPEAGVMHIDGEPVMAGKEIDVSVIRSALKVYTPKTLPFVYDVQRRINDVFRFFQRGWLDDKH